MRSFQVLKSLRTPRSDPRPLHTLLLALAPLSPFRALVSLRDSQSRALAKVRQAVGTLIAGVKISSEATPSAASFGERPSDNTESNARDRVFEAGNPISEKTPSATLEAIDRAINGLEAILREGDSVKEEENKRELKENPVSLSSSTRCEAETGEAKLPGAGESTVMAAVAAKEDASDKQLGTHGRNRIASSVSDFHKQTCCLLDRMLREAMQSPDVEVQKEANHLLMGTYVDQGTSGHSCNSEQIKEDGEFPGHMHVSVSGHKNLIDALQAYLRARRIELLSCPALLVFTLDKRVFQEDPEALGPITSSKLAQTNNPQGPYIMENGKPVTAAEPVPAPSGAIPSSAPTPGMDATRNATRGCTAGRRPKLFQKFSFPTFFRIGRFLPGGNSKSTAHSFSTHGEPYKRLKTESSALAMGREDAIENDKGKKSMVCAACKGKHRAHTCGKRKKGSQKSAQASSDGVSVSLSNTTTKSKAAKRGGDRKGAETNDAIQDAAGAAGNENMQGGQTKQSELLPPPTKRIKLEQQREEPEATSGKAVSETASEFQVNTTGGSTASSSTNATPAIKDEHAGKDDASHDKWGGGRRQPGIQTSTLEPSTVAQGAITKTQATSKKAKPSPAEQNDAGATGQGIQEESASWERISLLMFNAAPHPLYGYRQPRAPTFKLSEAETVGADQEKEQSKKTRCQVTSEQKSSDSKDMESEKEDQYRCPSPPTTDLSAYLDRDVRSSISVKSSTKGDGSEVTGPTGTSPRDFRPFDSFVGFNHTFVDPMSPLHRSRTGGNLKRRRAHADGSTTSSDSASRAGVTRREPRRGPGARRYFGPARVEQILATEDLASTNQIQRVELAKKYGLCVWEVDLAWRNLGLSKPKGRPPKGKRWDPVWGRYVDAAIATSANKKVNSGLSQSNLNVVSTGNLALSKPKSADGAEAEMRNKDRKTAVVSPSKDEPEGDRVQSNRKGDSVENGEKEEREKEEIERPEQSAHMALEPIGVEKEHAVEWMNYEESLVRRRGPNVYEWPKRETQALTKAVARHGVGDWGNILRDPEFAHIFRNRNLKDKWRELSAGADAQRATDEDSPAEWMDSGHVYIGMPVRRYFDGYHLDGTVTHWLPPDITHNEPALWHVVHADGVEEDLDEEEVSNAISESKGELDQEDSHKIFSSTELGYRRSKRKRRSKLTQYQRYARESYVLQSVIGYDAGTKTTCVYSRPAPTLTPTHRQEWCQDIGEWYALGHNGPSQVDKSVAVDGMFGGAAKNSAAHTLVYVRADDCEYIPSTTNSPSPVPSPSLSPLNRWNAAGSAPSSQHGKGRGRQRAVRRRLGVFRSTQEPKRKTTGGYWKTGKDGRRRWVTAREAREEASKRQQRQKKQKQSKAFVEKRESAEKKAKVETDTGYETNTAEAVVETPMVKPVKSLKSAEKKAEESSEKSSEKSTPSAVSDKQAKSLSKTETPLTCASSSQASASASKKRNRQSAKAKEDAWWQKHQEVFKMRQEMAMKLAQARGNKTDKP